MKNKVRTFNMDSNSNIVVQKFGGTSVATEEVRKKVIEKIIKAKKKGKLPVVVVSAMGRTGDPYATDTLLNLLNKDGNTQNSKEQDLIMACGEIISSTVLCSTLKSRGYDAEVLTGGQAGIITNSRFGDADILTVKPKRIIEVLEAGKIPVIAGFQGMTEDGDITTLGRGGSDTSAVIIGEAIKAKGIEIYKDVDGIMTADPKLVPNARVIPKITYTEIFQMADSGAKVIHSRAVEVAMRANIPLIIKNTFNDSKGSIICNSDEEECTSKRQKADKVVTSISYIPSRVQIIIEGDNSQVSKLLDEISQNKISIDIINIFTNRIAFTIETQYIEKLEEILENKASDYKLIENCSKVSCIGEKMHGVPGVMAKILKCLVDNNIDVLQTADSHTTIACLIKNEDVPKAVIALHDGFGLSK
jgi:aspartate kinase